MQRKNPLYYTCIFILFISFWLNLIWNSSGGWWKKNQHDITDTKQPRKIIKKKQVLNKNEIEEKNYCFYCSRLI